METAQTAQGADGPCVTCKHSENNGDIGVCTKYNRRRVRAFGGCLDLGSTVFYEFDTRMGLFNDPHKEFKHGNETKSTECG